MTQATQATYKMHQNEEFNLLERNSTGEEVVDMQIVGTKCSIQKRRFLFVLLFLLVSSLAGGSWFALDHVRKLRYIWGYEELMCYPHDLDCYRQICPDGMVWRKASDICRLQDTSFCCENQNGTIRCKPTNQKKKVCSKVQIAGVSSTAYKLFCRRGFLWVPWRKKCFRAVESEQRDEEY